MTRWCQTRQNYINKKACQLWQLHDIYLPPKLFFSLSWVLMKRAFQEDSSPEIKPPHQNPEYRLHVLLPKGTGHKRPEIFNTCLAIPFNEKRFKRRNSLHWHIFFSLKFNKLRKLNKRHLGAPKEDFKVLRARLNMLVAPSWQIKELRAMKKESGAEGVLQITPPSLKIFRNPLY